MRCWRTRESRKFEKSIWHFLTNRKRPLFLLTNKRARWIMNLVASDWINFEVSRGIFVSRFYLILSPLRFCYCKKQIGVSFSCVCSVIDSEFRHNRTDANLVLRVLSLLRERTVVEKGPWERGWTHAWKTDVNLLRCCPFKISGTFCGRHPLWKCKDFF